MASKAPVEAPDGTAARPVLPSSRPTSTSTVGLPRESRISRATTTSMDGTSISFWDVTQLCGRLARTPERNRLRGIGQPTDRVVDNADSEMFLNGTKTATSAPGIRAGAEVAEVSGPGPGVRRCRVVASEGPERAPLGS